MYGTPKSMKSLVAMEFICLTVRMKHFARESHFRRTERIVLRKDQFHRKGAPIEGSPIWASEVSRLLYVPHAFWILTL